MSEKAAKEELCRALKDALEDLDQCGMKLSQAAMKVATTAMSTPPVVKSATAFKDTDDNGKQAKDDGEAAAPSKKPASKKARTAPAASDGSAAKRSRPSDADIAAVNAALEPLVWAAQERDENDWLDSDEEDEEEEDEQEEEDEDADESEEDESSDEIAHAGVAEAAPFHPAFVDHRSPAVLQRHLAGRTHVVRREGAPNTVLDERTNTRMNQHAAAAKAVRGYKKLSRDRSRRVQQVNPTQK